MNNHQYWITKTWQGETLIRYSPDGTTLPDGRPSEAVFTRLAARDRDAEKWRKVGLFDFVLRRTTQALQNYLIGGKKHNRNYEFRQTSEAEAVAIILQLD